MTKGDSYVLDTHAFMWGLTEPQRLGETAREVMSARENRLLVSAASAWEISAKFRLGKLPGADFIVRNFEGFVAELGAQPLEISTSHALLGGSLDWGHRDPFDRMLAAQSLIGGHRLISRDVVFSDVQGLEVIWD
ncbi:type II toxin-antitoxin system VapC family toxin [Corynebacterium sp. P3-F1]|uniref:type II toxin-antitoxin system VapC family toxin n=1 Tax=Corynebacterium sp. P3-F1 TaxID=3059080 RepID=UPI00265D0AAA|nr:type II toxin-antitoxin system VapC family toxin [Corynebacterium sp. P3-F1]WKK62282.1 type II toxin-antitoxin system VapC family toxin [Corynebacterium sp. P3-F1]